MRYLELVPKECAIYLEDPLRAPPGVWELGPMMQEAEAYFELRKVYSQDASGGLPRQRAQVEQSALEEQQNATWAN